MHMLESFNTSILNFERSFDKSSKSLFENKNLL